MMAPDLPTARWRKSSRSTSQANCVEVAVLDADWRKSSHSGNAASCVEVAVLDADWRKSSRSGNTSNCVEVAFAGPGVAVRDSKNPTGPALVFPAAAFRDFLASLKTGTFDPA